MADRDPSRAKGRPSLAEAAAIDRTLRDAAMQVLLEHGRAATVNAVAKLAGVSRKSLYARYPGKNELFVDVIRSLLSEVEPLTVPPGDNFKERLGNYVAAALAMIAKPQSNAVQRLIMLDPVYLGTLRDELRGAAETLFFRPLLEILDRAAREGEIAVDDPLAVAQVLIKLIFAEAHIPKEDCDRWYAPRPNVNYAELIVEIVVNGLAPREKPQI